jgi:hypothetical protein
MRVLADTLSIPLSAARQWLASRLAVIEAVPYRSVTGGHSRQLLHDLQSSRLAKGFVHDHVMARVRARDAVVVAVRAATFWELPKHPGVVCLESKNARSVRFSVDSSHGKLIRKALGCPDPDTSNDSWSR